MNMAADPEAGPRRVGTIGDVGLRAYTTCAWALSLTERGDPAEALAFITGALPTVASNPDYVEYKIGLPAVYESIAARMAGVRAGGVVAARPRHRPGGGPARVPTRESMPSPRLPRP